MGKAHRALSLGRGFEFDPSLGRLSSLIIHILMTGLPNFANLINAAYSLLRYTWYRRD